MGMALAFHSISDENIDRLIADPPLVWRVIAPDDPEIYQMTRAGAQPGFVARLFGAKSPAVESDLPTLSYVDGEGLDSDVDKAWHGIHYLLTGTAWEGEAPLNFLISGGEEIGSVDVGYGPARAIRRGDLSELVTALDAISTDELRGRFNPEEMMNLEIYPDIWDREPEDDDVLGYCIEHYELMKTFFRKARDNELGILLYIC